MKRKPLLAPLAAAAPLLRSLLLRSSPHREGRQPRLRTHMLMSEAERRYRARPRARLRVEESRASCRPHDATAVRSHRPSSTSRSERSKSAAVRSPLQASRSRRPRHCRLLEGSLRTMPALTLKDRARRRRLRVRPLESAADRSAHPSQASIPRHRRWPRPRSCRCAADGLGVAVALSKTRATACMRRTSPAAPRYARFALHDATASGTTHLEPQHRTVAGTHAKVPPTHRCGGTRCPRAARLQTR
jgi:hypothetical protein